LRQATQINITTYFQNMQCAKNRPRSFIIIWSRNCHK